MRLKSIGKRGIRKPESPQTCIWFESCQHTDLESVEKQSETMTYKLNKANEYFYIHRQKYILDATAGLRIARNNLCVRKIAYGDE